MSAVLAQWLVGGGILAIFLVSIFAFAWWWLGKIDEMEKAAEDHFFSEIDAVTQRFKARAKGK